jgi:NUMOD3 motif
MNIHEVRYGKFITSRQYRYLKSAMVEKHHILPRSLGGSDEEINIIKLTPREHYIAHLILWKAYGGKMATAFFLMQQDRTILHLHERTLTAKQYERLRQDYCLSNRDSHIGKPSKLKGKSQSKELVEKRSKALQGHKHSEETKKKLSDKRKEYFTNPENRKKLSERIKQTFRNGRISYNKGVKMNEEQRERIRKTKKVSHVRTLGFTGHIHSEESKKKISKKISGKNNGMYGKHHTEETKQKMSKARIDKAHQL